MKNLFWKTLIFLRRMMSEDNGNPSSARFFNFYAVIILIPCVAFVLLFVTLNYRDLITATLDAILLFITGIFGLKVWQKGKEKQQTSNVKSETEETTK